ncbi:hypothetical protein NDU88_000901 [Pleurodeles waltl]|uniref:Uncharacterized protein n=1 Tax=Pleurodeles waltl TaxID=8319 RepID=A0AAV7MJ10_PLEWA|nr:hypothetical protein NDU88_000901 [Pleurodeles waltl]
MLQGDDGAAADLLGVWGERDDSKGPNKGDSDLPASERTYQTQGAEPIGSAQVIRNVGDISVEMCAGGSNHVVLKPMAGTKKTGTCIKAPEWAKDGGDKFYSLTEESDLTSSEHNQSESGSSIFSETGSISPSREPTVRQQQRHRKCVKARSGPSEGTEFSAFNSNKTLKWDYAGIKLTEAPVADDQLTAGRGIEGSTGGPVVSISTASAESGMLQSIYDLIKELQTETRADNCRARIATKRLQGTIRKVAKSCIEIETELNTMEERTMAVEADVEALRAQCASQDGQLADILWKLEDHENRRRRNNLCFLGFGEGVEGNNIQAYMIKILRFAFPELTNWDWETEDRAEAQNTFSVLIIRERAHRVMCPARAAQIRAGRQQSPDGTGPDSSSILLAPPARHQPLLLRSCTPAALH